LREPDDRDGAIQLDALLDGTQALKSQAGRQSAAATRHSRLNSDLTAPQDLLQEALGKVLADLAPTLAQLPEARSLAVVLDVGSGLPEDIVQRVWLQAWGASGIRQTAQAFEVSGLEAVDQWLDERIADPELLMVVALQIAPQQLKGTAEVAVGLLLGNRLTQTTLTPRAYLHRPEQERELATEHLRYAANQALQWVPVPADAVERVWRAGVDAQRGATLAAVFSDAGLPMKHEQKGCDLDALLGQAGKASPWLAIAAAAQLLERGAGPQFIFSGNSSVEAGLWCTVLMPVPPLSK
jgi:hypothetical protein